MEKDTVFAEKKKSITPFCFNEKVAAVFDDMLMRSVPFYSEVLKQQAMMTQRYYVPGTRIYDLGCSHGNLGMRILSLFDAAPFAMTGVDNSYPMIQKYQTRLGTKKNAQSIDLVCGCIEDMKIHNASVVVVNLTLQFLNPEKRNGLIRSIYQGLSPGGVLLLTEKTIHPDPGLKDLELDFYCQFKRENGYSELEISQKRDALEKVLIPESVQIHENRLLSAGFSVFNIWLKWFNFTSMLAIK
ncbi:MAG: carboxy-S-adenosyl-L-methionine synthase CmoA [Desulfobacter sp.]|nr:carboxy-S-adenosyl-L-methionine synthase CmoA [Desulfobacter sp.]WDP86674.1 MAG: carboxy-S-adenosyl-L-methionine synthase CmoA [Desulfobacter sp.]